MQTFLPYPSFSESAEHLDRIRLGNQRRECKQLLSALGQEIRHGTLMKKDPSKGWVNHPACKMWRGYEIALAAYNEAIITEWVARGYNNTMERWQPPEMYLTPPWLGDEAFHASHRSNLLRKDAVHYGKFGWTEGPDLEYVWPVS